MPTDHINLTVPIKVLEYCGLRTKDKTAKQNLDNMIKDIKKSEEQEKAKANQKEHPLSQKDQAILQAKSIGIKLKHNSEVPSSSRKSSAAVKASSSALSP